jgi:hypothetical protein
MSAPDTTVAPVTTENSVITSESPTPKSGVSSAIRISIAVLIGIVIAIFMLLWDGGYMPHTNMPAWLGPYIFAPLIAVILGYGADCLLQQLSCGKVEWLLQLQRVLVIPIPYVVTWGFLHFIPGMRWPIEGLVQDSSVEIKRGLSSGFYAFWIALYTQSIMNGGSQLCPK